MKKDYYLGLDIGTTSVGWAVTDSEYNLCRFKGKDMWGIRLFPEAETAEGRRQKRTNRRRLRRRNQRIKLLQMLFAEEIAKVDDTFFIRLNDSKLHMEDKSTEFKQVLFADSDYTDIEYYKEYPTIYHLRKELIESDEAHDIRFIYLALHHIMKSRGHFLISGDLNNAKDFSVTFEQFINVLNDSLHFDIEIQDTKKFEALLKDRGMSRSDKEKELVKLVNYDTEELDKDDKKKRKDAVSAVCKLVVGNQGDAAKLFPDTEFEIEDSLTKIKFSESKYDEQIVPAWESGAPEEYYVISVIKSLYDWSVLVDILDNEEMISYAKVSAYEKHKNNLAKLKNIMSKYCDKKEYKLFFDGRSGSDNYSNYIGYVKTNGKKINVKKCKSDEDFYKNLEKILNKVEKKITSQDKAIFEELLEETKLQTLLPLQRSKNNGVVPKQVHEIELKKIIENAKKHYAFLSDKDENGISVADKIISIFYFRIPYYVGPLSKRHADQGANVWIERKEGKENEYIYPWNFDDIVDDVKSNEAFIRRMTNKCTYLPWEDVLPKSSLLYQKYMVLNELNNLKIRSKDIPVDLKQELFNNLFLNSKSKVTGNRLLNYLKKDDSELTKEDLSGFDNDYKSSLSSFHFFKDNVFGDRVYEDKVEIICEDIIKWATIYDDGSMVAKMAKRTYGDKLTDEQLKTIESFRCSGWGQFSERFLKGFEGTDNDTGEISTIIDAMWKNNYNLMQILSSRFTFMNEIKKLSEKNLTEITRVSYEDLVENLFTSPANKRAIWQAVQIAEEIRKVMSGEPAKIFIEMPRGGDKKKERTKTRKQTLIELYKACEKDVREWAISDIESRDERDFNSKKLYLYYTQMGRCAYTGNIIDLDELMRGSSRWDIDHIYPQAIIKDDSLDNIVLVERNKNIEKSDKLIPNGWQKKMKGIWKVWKDKKLISDKKYNRLMRTAEFSDDELSGFIARQLVETSQSTKLVADLLERIYCSSKIIRVKAGLVSRFRKEPLGILKSRLINDFHHAKDAYLTIVVGNVYNTRFTDNYRAWIKQNKNKGNDINKVFYDDVDNAWVAPKGKNCSGTIETVRATVKKNNVLYTEYTWCEKGELFQNNEPTPKGEANIPISSRNPEVYGGYKGAKTSYFVQVEVKSGNTRKKVFVAIPKHVEINSDSDIVNFCESKGYEEVIIKKSRIKFNSLIVVDGFPLRIRGESGKNITFKPNLQLLLDEKNSETVRRIEKWEEKENDNIVDSVFDNIYEDDLIELYDILLCKMKTVFLHRPSNSWGLLEKNQNSFLKLTLTDKLKVLHQMIILLRCDATPLTADLTLINGSSNTGRTMINNNTLAKKRLILIHQSITGLYSQKEIL